MFILLNFTNTVNIIFGKKLKWEKNSAHAAENHNQKQK